MQVEGIFSSCTSFRKSVQEDRAVQHWQATTVAAGSSRNLESYLAIDSGRMVVTHHFVPLLPDGSPDTAAQRYTETYIIEQRHEHRDTVKADTSTEIASVAFQTDSTYKYKVEETKSQHARNFSFRLGVLAGLILAGILLVLVRKLQR